MEYVMGDDGQMYSTMGDNRFQTVGDGRPGMLRLPTGGATLRLPPPPGWRQDIAPGVDLPGEALEQLVLEPANDDGVFSASVTQIRFSAKTQRAFRGERVLAIIGRSGTSAAGVLPLAQGGFFVGTQIVGASLADVPLDTYGPTAFGVRMAFPQATPGMDIQARVGLRGSLSGADTIAVSIVIIGRSVR